VNINPIIATDSYKVSHYKQYPPGTKRVFSYFESRGFSPRMRDIHDLAVGRDQPLEVVFFAALQHYLKAYLQPINMDDIFEAREMFKAHFGTLDFFNEAGWERILLHHGGWLPIRIRAVPEGLRVPVHNVLLTAENIDPELPWLTNYLETRLCHIWYPVTVATLSYYCRKIIERHLHKSGDPAEADFKLHDFGYRGVSSEDAAAIGGLAHLVSFKGSDTMAALHLARQRYYCNMAGFSIPAAEHSTITSWGRENEAKAYENMLDQYPEGLVAVVSDSYNIYHACEFIWGGLLRDKVLKRKGTLVIRPDSGDPLTVLPTVLSILGNQDNGFGFTVNEKGYKVLHPNVRVIQGDGCTPQMIDAILTTIEKEGWSASNLAFGMGGGLLQQVNRDDLKCAFKCSAVEMEDGREVQVWKDPITDPGKRSKSGRLTLYAENGQYITAPKGGHEQGRNEVLKTVYEDGYMLITEKFDVIRDRARFPGALQQS
jgi:nicotinamide phosphoribosyltransferase